MFTKSAKGKRGTQKVEERIKQTLEEIGALQDQLFFVESAKDAAELEELAASMYSVASQGKSQSGTGENVRRKLQHSMFHEFITASGKIVLVGRSAAGNEYLVRKKARKGDLWFHVKDWPSAHVLLTQRGKEPVSVEEKEFAAGLAVSFSKARGKGKVEVMVADVRDLAHPKGGMPGQVTVKTYKTMLSEGGSGEI